MRIVQVLYPQVSQYAKKSQRIDFELLRGRHEVTVVSDPRHVVDADLAMTYGGEADLPLPEAVAEAFFIPLEHEPARPPIKRIATFERPSISRMVQQTIPRLGRTRDDIEWELFDHPPSAEDLARCEVWVDPAMDDRDLDGFTAEALVCGKAVVASRTAINVYRLDDGRAGLLVPPGDPNELTHAILAALFKPEVAQQKLEAARETISRFHPRHRLRALMLLLDNLHA